jgi:hypothetical protein
MNLGKKILIILILIRISMMLSDVLRFLGVIAVTGSYAKISNIIFSMFVITVLSLLFKHKYWILGCVFSGLGRLAAIVTSHLYEAQLALSVSIRFAIIVDMTFTFISVVYFYKLYQEDFSFEKYLRFKDL